MSFSRIINGAQTFVGAASAFLKFVATNCGTAYQWNYPNQVYQTVDYPAGDCFNPPDNPSFNFENFTLTNGNMCIPCIVNYTDKNQFVTTRDQKEYILNTCGLKPPMAPNIQSINKPITDDLQFVKENALTRDYFPYGTPLLYSLSYQLMRWKIPIDGRDMPVSSFPESLAVYLNGPLEDSQLLNNGAPFFEDERSYINDVGIYYQDKSVVLDDMRGLVQVLQYDILDRSYRAARNTWIIPPNFAVVCVISATPFTIAPDIIQNNVAELKTVIAKILIQMSYKISYNVESPLAPRVVVTQNEWGSEYGLDNPTNVADMPLVNNSDVTI